jgi:hypothetical protein
MESQSTESTEETYEGILARLDVVETKLYEIYKIPKDALVEELNRRFREDEIGEYDHGGLPAEWLYLRSAKSDWEETIIPAEWMRLKAESLIAPRLNDDRAKAAYGDAREHAISAFLSILSGGCSEHVVMWNYTKLRDYLSEKAGLPTMPEKI